MGQKPLLSAIPNDIEESEKEELLKKVVEEKAMIKKGYSRVTEKIKELRQRFSSAVPADLEVVLESW